MNAKLKLNIILILTGILILSLVSCTNPAGPDLSKLQDTVNEEETGETEIIDEPIVEPEPEPEPETGIVSDPDTGLIAGLSLEGDAILINPSVVEIQGVEWVPGISGNAMSGDADGDFLRIADGELPELTVSGSVEAWVYPEENIAWAGILHKGHLTNFADEAWSLQYDGNKRPYFYFVGESGSAEVRAPDQLSLNTWHNLTATWVYNNSTNETIITLYIDGSEAGTVTKTGIGPARDTDGDLIIGSQLPDPKGSYGHITFRGLIDEVALYEVTRTPEEIEAVYLQYFPAS